MNHYKSKLKLEKIINLINPRIIDSKRIKSNSKDNKLREFNKYLTNKYNNFLKILSTWSETNLDRKRNKKYL